MYVSLVLSQLPNLLWGCKAEDIHQFLYYVLKSCLVLGLLLTYRVVDHMASIGWLTYI